MKTRRRSYGEIWPCPGPLPGEYPENTPAIKDQSYTSRLSAKEMSHIAKCGHHFGTVPLVSWERIAWSQRGVRKHPHSLQARCAVILICENRRGWPFVRTDARDQQWYCGGHDLLLPKQQSKLLELPEELRNGIYKHAFPSFLELSPRRGHKGSTVMCQKFCRAKRAGSLTNTPPYSLNHYNYAYTTPIWTGDRPKCTQKAKY